MSDEDAGASDADAMWPPPQLSNCDDSGKAAQPDSGDDDSEISQANAMDFEDSSNNKPSNNSDSSTRFLQSCHGVPLKDLLVLTDCNMPVLSSQQLWMIDKDKCVRLPHQYPKYPSPDSSASRWCNIQKSLLNIPDSADRPTSFTFLRFFEDVILRYNGLYSNKWDFQGIAAFYEQELSYQEKQDFMKVLYKMGLLALRLPQIIHQPIPLLSQSYKRNLTRTLHLTRLQIACLLANAFFCTFPSRNADPTHRKGANNSTGRNDGPPLPSINFNSLFKMPVQRDSISSQYSKYRCIMNYFRRVTDTSVQDKLAHQYVTFERRVLSDTIDWKESTSLFTKLGVTAEGTIEADGRGLSHVDFANKMVGGGVLGRGCVQEEIRFLGFTEMIVSRLFTEELMDNECLIVSGCEQYNNYEGYSDTFRWTGDCNDQTKKDSHGRCLAQVIVMDAHKYYDNSDQYLERWITRELNKAYCGFSYDNAEAPAIATGNWGCGDFRGNRHLKSLIQLMAASQAKRDVFYFTHREKKLAEELFQVHSLLRKHKLTVGDAWRLIEQYANYQQRVNDSEKQLFHFILERYSSGPPQD